MICLFQNVYFVEVSSYEENPNVPSFISRRKRRKKKILEKKVKISNDGDLCNSHQLRLLHKISNDRDLCNLFSI